MKALIFSGGDFCGLPDNIDINEYDLIIAADSGYIACVDSGISPHIVIGDFDSFPQDMITAKKIIRLNPVKDMTDTQEAIDTAIEKGADEITLLGALGGRIDHTLANIHLLKYALSKGVKAEIADKDTCIYIVQDNCTVMRREGFCLSLIPLTDCSGVSIRGVFYPLENALMPVGNPYGISNEFTEDCAHIEVKSGELLLMLCKS